MTVLDQHVAQVLLPNQAPANVEAVQPIRTEECDEMFSVRHR